MTGHRKSLEHPKGHAGEGQHGCAPQPGSQGVGGSRGQQPAATEGCGEKKGAETK